MRSARFAGEDATDEENLDLLISRLADEEDRSVAYVCVIAYIDADGAERLFEGVCEGTLHRQRRAATAASATTRPSSPTTPARTTSARWPSSSRTKSTRSATAAAPGASWRGRSGRGRAAVIRTKSGAAGLSIASNSVLIVLKLVAGAITGSIAIITEAIHSAIDLLASVIAFFSVRAADEPADREHPYGHEKVENLAAAIEGMLILVGAGIIIFEATRRLDRPRRGRATSGSASR